MHRLAAGSCTHSEVNESYHLVPKSELLGPTALEEILEQVATRRPAVGLEPEKFSLRDELWDEYDPTFFHLSLAAHQQASERRPSAPAGAKPKPMVGPPPPAHPVFAGLRVSILSDATLLRMIYSILKRALAPAGAAADEAAASTSAVTETVVVRALNLLVLAVHVHDEEAAGGGAAAASASSSTSASASAAAAAAEPPHPEPSGANDYTATSPHPAVSAAATDNARAVAAAARRRFFRLVVAEEHGRVPTGGGGADGRGAPPPFACLVSALLTLESSSWSAEPQVKSTVKWLLAELAERDFSGEVEDKLRKLRRARGGAGQANDLEARKKAAQERALKFMQQKASSFMASMDIGSETEDEEEAEGGGGGGGRGTVVPAAAGGLAQGQGLGSDHTTDDGAMAGTTSGSTDDLAGGTQGDDTTMPSAEPARVEPTHMLALDGPAPECIICRESTAQPLGYVVSEARRSAPPRPPAPPAPPPARTHPPTHATTPTHNNHSTSTSTSASASIGTSTSSTSAGTSTGLTPWLVGRLPSSDVLWAPSPATSSSTPRRFCQLGRWLSFAAPATWL